jgi:hypothetical protein
VQDTFKRAFPGGYAGWAHSVLFVQELPSASGLAGSPVKPKQKKQKKPAVKAEASVEV